MECSVKLFGPFARVVQHSAVIVPLDAAATVADLRRRLAELEPGLAPMLPGTRFAVNHSFAAESQVLQSQDEIALIGLVSGG